MMMQLLIETLHFEMRSSSGVTAWPSDPGPGHRGWRGGWWRWWPWPGWPPGPTGAAGGNGHQPSPRSRGQIPPGQKSGRDWLEAANFARVAKYRDLFHRWDSSSESKSVVFLKYSKFKCLVKLTARIQRYTSYLTFVSKVTPDEVLFNYRKNFRLRSVVLEYFTFSDIFHLTTWLLEADYKINRPGPKFIFWPILLFVVTNLFLPVPVMPAEMLFVVRVTEKESLALLASLDSITVRTLSSLCLEFSVSPLFILFSLAGAGDKRSEPDERSSLCMQANTVFR